MAIANIKVFAGENGCLPKRFSNGAAGYDMYSSEAVLLKSQTTTIINTSIRMSIPGNMYGQLKSRSSYAAIGITVSGGVIGNDYRGEIKVILNNTSINEFIIQKHERIAQIIFLPLPKVTLISVPTKDDLTQTVRQNNGFGSTDV